MIKLNKIMILLLSAMLLLFGIAGTANQNAEQADKSSSRNNSLNTKANTRENANNDVEPAEENINNGSGKIDVEKLEQANELYREGKYEEALKKYSEAGAKAPNHEILNYNIGNVLYKTSKIKDAVEKYSTSRDLPEALYNRGNALYRMQNLQEALKSYKQALIKNPEDMEAKYNYELVKKMMKDRQQKGQDQKDQEEKSKEKQKKEDEKQDKQQPGKQKKSKEEQKRIDPKQAESMLRALKQKEKDLLKKLLKAKKAKPQKVEKDW